MASGCRRSRRRAQRGGGRPSRRRRDHRYDLPRALITLRRKRPPPCGLRAASISDLCTANAGAISVCLTCDFAEHAVYRLSPARSYRYHSSPRAFFRMFVPVIRCIQTSRDLQWFPDMFEYTSPWHKSYSRYERGKFSVMGAIAPSVRVHLNVISFQLHEYRVYGAAFTLYTRGSTTTLFSGAMCGW